MTIDKALEMSPELKAKYEGDETTRKVIDMARAIEGMPAPCVNACSRCGDIQGQY